MELDLSNFNIRKTNPIILGNDGLPKNVERYTVKGQGILGIEIFKDEINLSIVKNFPTYDSFTYKSIEGSLSENITIKELSLSSEFKKIEVGKLILKPSNLSNFYFFIHTILNSTYKSFNYFKLESRCSVGVELKC